MKKPQTNASAIRSRRTGRRNARKEPVLAGWREWASLPDLGVNTIKAKLDTGARTSALHAWNIWTFERDGEDWVQFDLHPVQRNNAVCVTCEAPLVGRRHVKSTSGKAEERFVIRTTVMLGGETRAVEVTLTNRDEMGFRMLLGRTAMHRWVVVDPARSYLHGKNPLRSNNSGAMLKTARFMDTGEEE